MTCSSSSRHGPQRLPRGEAARSRGSSSSPTTSCSRSSPRPRTRSACSRTSASASRASRSSRSTEAHHPRHDLSRGREGAVQRDARPERGQRHGGEVVAPGGGHDEGLDLQGVAEVARRVHDQAAHRVGARLAGHGHHRRRPDLIGLERGRGGARSGRQQGPARVRGQVHAAARRRRQARAHRPLKLQRTTLGAMVTLDVHGRDVLTNMSGEGTETTNDFELALAAALLLRPPEVSAFSRSRSSPPSPSTAGSTSATPSGSS